MDVDSNNIDNDFDAKFFEQFRSMGTTDKDVLIAEFQSVIGNQVNHEQCAFFLDMNNWNLQNAVCSYYDFQQPSGPASVYGSRPAPSGLPSMTLLAETTVGQDQAVAPSTKFVKTWKIKNSGSDRWPPGCHMRFCEGSNLTSIERRMVHALAPGEEVEVALELTSPDKQGSYLGSWRMANPIGIYFGDVINVHVVVAEGGLLGLTQQLARIEGPGVHNTAAMDQGDMMSGSTLCPTTGYSCEVIVPAPPLVSQNQPSLPTVIDEDTEMS